MTKLVGWCRRDREHERALRLRLSEESRLHDILRDNARLVAEEAKRRADQEKRTQVERQQELARLSYEHRRSLGAPGAS